MKKDTLARGAKSAQFAGGYGETDVTRNLYKGEDKDEPLATFTPAPKARKVFRPLGEVILVRRCVPEKEFDIIVTDTIEKDKPAEGTVIEVGPDVYAVMAGDNIVFGKYAGAEIKLNGETLLLMEVKEVLGLLEDEKGEN